jgi:hypothetical protein
LPVGSVDTTGEFEGCQTDGPHSLAVERRPDPQVDTMTTPLRSTRSPQSFASGVSARLLAATLAFAGLATTGCQVDVGGQTLPSAYYLQDDIQYFPAGPEFKLSKEAAVQKAYKDEMGEDNCEKCGGCGSCGSYGGPVGGGPGCADCQ